MDDQLLLGALAGPRRPPDADLPPARDRPGAGVGLLERRDLRQRGLRRPGPAGFDASNPNDPRYSWGALDRVVDSARRHGLKVMLSITTPGARAGRANGGRAALAPAGGVRRLRGGGGPALRLAGRPLRRRERAQPARLAASPDRRRRPVLAPPLPRAAPGRLPAHQGRRPRLGGARRQPRLQRRRPARRPSTGIRPLAFLRAMACVDRSLRPITSGRCANFRPVPADAFGHHPYKFFGSPRPALPQGRRRRDRRRPAPAARCSTACRPAGGSSSPRGGRLLGLLHGVRLPDRSARPVRRDLAAQPQPLPPGGRLPGRGARPRIRALQPVPAHRRRRCAGPAACAATRSSRAACCSPTGARSRAYRSFPDPFVIDGSRFWGQVRPGGRHTVRLQYRRGGGRFRTIRRARTDSAGYFRVRLRRRKGQYRYTYRAPAAPRTRSNPLAAQPTRDRLRRPRTRTRVESPPPARPRRSVFKPTAPPGSAMLPEAARARSLPGAQEPFAHPLKLQDILQPDAVSVRRGYVPCRTHVRRPQTAPRRRRGPRRGGRDPRRVRPRAGRVRRAPRVPCGARRVRSEGASAAQLLRQPAHRLGVLALGGAVQLHEAQEQRRVGQPLEHAGEAALVELALAPAAAARASRADRAARASTAGARRRCSARRGAARASRGGSRRSRGSQSRTSCLSASWTRARKRSSSRRCPVSPHSSI